MATPFEKFVNAARGRDEKGNKKSTFTSRLLGNAANTAVETGGGLLKDIIAKKIGIKGEETKDYSLPSSSPFAEITSQGKSRVAARLKANRERAAQKKAERYGAQ